MNNFFRSLNLKLIIGIVVVLCGIFLLTFSNYITVQVAIGRGDISRAQAQVNGINGLIDNSSRVHGLSNLFTGSAQNQINAGIQKANYYEKLSWELKIVGFVLLIIGALFLFFGRKPGKWYSWRS